MFRTFYREKEREREVSVCVRTFDTIAAPSSFDFSQLSVNGSRIEATSAAFSVWLSSLLLSKVLRFGLVVGGKSIAAPPADVCSERRETIGQSVVSRDERRTD